MARAAMKVGDLAPDEALDRFTEARSRLEPLAESAADDYFAALEGLGRAQLKNRDVLGALASFSRALQIAEARGNRLDIASSNFWVGTVLAYNGETEAGAAKLRKAFETYRALAGGHVNAVVDSPAGYRKALAELAAQAPPDLRRTIEAQLHEFSPG
jgi:tetratricopeptide (TPR) repeat protein